MRESRRTSDDTPPPRPALLLLAVAALTALAFAPALNAGFVNYDDVLLFAARGFRGLDAPHLGWMFSTTYACSYMPLSWLTLGGDFLLGGMNPVGYHLTNILIHCANAALFALAALELFARGRPTPRDRWAAAAAALLFAVHPLRVECVAWVFERRELVAGFFFLAAALFWLISLRTGQARPARWRRFALVAFALSLLSKLSGVMLPAALVALDVYPFERLPNSPRKWTDPRLRPVWLEKIPFLALSAAALVVGVRAQIGCDALVSLQRIGVAGRLVLAAVAPVFYVGKTLWPTNLTVVYRWSSATLEIPLLIGGIALAVGAAAAYRRRALRAPLLAASGWYLILLVPVLGLVKLGSQAASDRYTYLPCLAWAALAGAGLRVLPKRASAVWGLTAVAIALLVASSRAQSLVWRDSTSLWRHALRLEPVSRTAHQDLADALLARGRDGEAILYLEEELRLYPDDADSRRILDAVLARTHTTLRDHAAIYNALGVERAERGELAQALWHFRKALEYDPGSMGAAENLARAERGETTGYAR